MIPDGRLSKIILFGNDPGDQQWSILDYGEQLQRALTEIVSPNCQIILQAPHTPLGWQKFKRWRPGRVALMYWSRYLRYPKVVRQNHADVYHFLDYGNGWVMRYVDPNRTIVTCHDLIPLLFHHKKISLWPWVSTAAYQHSIKGLLRARVILADSSCTRNDLITRLGYPADKIHVIPLGIDPKLHPPPTKEAIISSRAAFHLPEGLLLLHVGQTVFYKNIEGALYTLKILLQRKESAWLIRAGTFLGMSQRRLVHRLGIADRVIELGPLPREQLRQIYHAADILIQPSWYEGFGLPPLEAMACGLPVVISNRGALPETASNAALVADPNDSDAFADAVQKIVTNSNLRSELRARGLKRASEFTWEKTARRTLEIYCSVSKHMKKPSTL